MTENQFLALCVGMITGAMYFWVRDAIENRKQSPETKFKRFKLLTVSIVIGAPFAVGAALEFLPSWLALPTTFLCCIFWLGAMKQIDSFPEEKHE